ncbi:MAG: PIN domain-containing protein [Candidatus Sulfotelmatobacter sp.]
MAPGPTDRSAKTQTSGRQVVVLLDADVVIRGEKDIFNLGSWVASRPDDQFEIAAITVAELWHGVERAVEPQRSKRRRYLETIVSALPIVPYTEQTAYEHARIWAQLQSAGKMIGAYDLIVAATALERGSRLATFNKRHFARVKGLHIIDPQ